MESNKTSRTTEISNPALGFQQLKGFFILDFLPIMTRFQMATVLNLYTLVEFKDGGGIEYRTVMFWHAVLNDGYLKIIVYDIRNKILITKLHNIESEESETTDWFLIEDEVLKDELLEFEF